MCGEWVLYFQYKPMIGTGVTTLILEINRLQFRHFVPLNKKKIFFQAFSFITNTVDRDRTYIKLPIGKETNSLGCRLTLTL